MLVFYQHEKGGRLNKYKIVYSLPQNGNAMCTLPCQKGK